MSADRFIDYLYFKNGLLVLILSFLVFKVVTTFNRYRRLPPGPWGLPILGYLPFLGKNPHLTMMELSKKYGDVMIIKMGSWPSVVLSGYHTIHQATENYGEEFAGRPNFITFQGFVTEGGTRAVQFISNPGKDFDLKRKTNVESLIIYSRGHDNRCQYAMIQEAKTMAENFLTAGRNSNPFDPNNEIELSTSCTFYEICFGLERNSREDETFKGFMNTIENVLKNCTGELDLLPWLSLISKQKHNAFLKAWQPYQQTVRKLIEEHLPTYDPEHIRDVFDAATKQAAKAKDDLSGVSETELRDSGNGLLLAGAETTSTHNKWSILYLIGYPEAQKRIQAEIDDVIGNRIPANSDMKQMPFTEAFILESIRHSSSVPLLLPHSTTCDVKFKGFEIPEGTVVWLNAYSSNMDGTVWKDPTDFSPQRFLTETGIDRSLSNKIAAFGFGKRRCIGEQMTKMQTFLQITVLLQKCSLKNPTEQKIDWNGEYTVTMRPPRYHILVEPRE